MLIDKITASPETITFNEVIEYIDSNFTYTPTAFSNGGLLNEAGQNVGSCKIFAFAQLNNLTEQQTLHCFGHFYRDDVLAHPQGDDHQNIRRFMASGWKGVQFQGAALAQA